VKVQVSDVYDKLSKAKTKIVVLEGGSGCFHGDQLVVTKRGNTPIAKIKEGDIVKSYNEKAGKHEWKKVISTFQFKNTKPMISLRLKDGTIIQATEDHKFYFHGKWVQLKQIIELWKNGK